MENAPSVTASFVGLRPALPEERRKEGLELRLFWGEEKQEGRLNTAIKFRHLAKD